MTREQKKWAITAGTAAVGALAGFLLASVRAPRERAGEIGALARIALDAARVGNGAARGDLSAARELARRFAGDPP